MKDLVGKKVSAIADCGTYTMSVMEETIEELLK